MPEPDSTKLFESIPNISGDLGAKSLGQVHIGWLDGLRALTAFYVVIFHFGQYTTGPVSPENPHPWWVEFHFDYAHLAVALFIVLSGFCLMLPVIGNKGRLSTDTLTFFKRRALRILPAYYASILVSLGVAWMLPQLLRDNLSFPDYLSQETPGLIQRLFLVHDIFSPLWSPNGPLWSVGVEWKIYLVFPFLIWFWRKCGAVPTLMLTLVISIPLYNWTMAQGYSLASPHFLSLFLLGAIGSCIAFSPLKFWIFLRRRIPWIAVMVISFWAVFCYPLEPVVKDLVWGVGCCSFLIWCVCGSMGGNLAQSLLNIKPLVWLGGFSYSIYLLHFPFLHLFFHYSHFEATVLPLQMLGYFTWQGLPVLILVCYLFSLLFEKPFIRRKNHKQQSSS